eukprot:scaffold27650_cov59-Phaeocystis_antarctica.AAC.1
MENNFCEPHAMHEAVHLVLYYMPFCLNSSWSSACAITAAGNSSGLRSGYSAAVTWLGLGSGLGWG